MEEFKIETSRLVLVPVSEQYRQEMFKEFSPEVTRFMMPQPANIIAETDAFIAASRANMERGEEIVCSILLRDTGEYVGNCGLHSIKTPHPRLGIWIKPSAHGNHFGREAVAALKEWADAHLTYEYLAYDVAKENWPSRKIAEALGGSIAAEGEKTNVAGKTLPFVKYHIPR